MISFSKHLSSGALSIMLSSPFYYYFCISISFYSHDLNWTSLQCFHQSFLPHLLCSLMMKVSIQSLHIYLFEHYSNILNLIYLLYINGPQQINLSYLSISLPPGNEADIRYRHNVAMCLSFPVYTFDKIFF